MTKKFRRSKPSARTAAPAHAQLEAVRRLSQSGRDEEARARVEELRARYPDFKPLLALAWEVEDNAGYFVPATFHAWQWAQASPNSTAALQALADSAMAIGMVALVAWASQQLAQIEGQPFPDLSPVHGELGDTSFEQSVKLDLSRLFLSNERYEDAAAVLDGIDHPSARNNIMIARFALGDIDAALAGIEENWRRDKRNLFGLHQLVRLRLWTGGRAAADELEGALIEGRPARAEDAYGQMFGLLLLGAHAEAIDAWRAVRDAEFWGDDGVMQVRCAYFAAVAALREGDFALADECLSEVLELDPDNIEADLMVEALAMRNLGMQPDPVAGEPHDWYPATWIMKLRNAHPNANETVFDALYRRCNAHPDYLAIAAELGGTAVRILALGTLEQRTLAGDRAALDTLLSLLTRPCGPDETRLELGRWLEENGYLAPDQPHPMLTRGEVHEQQLIAMQLTSEPKATHLPPDAHARHEAMHGLLARNDLTGALQIAQQLAADYPDHPMVLGNLASIKEGLGHADEEIDRLYRRAAEIDPAYLFAQTGLARLAIRKGDIDLAKTLLKPLLGRKEYHFSEWRSILMTERMLAQQQGDLGAVMNLDEGLRALQEQFG